LKNPAPIAPVAVISALWPVAVGVNKKSEERERKRKVEKMKKDKESQKRKGRCQKGGKAMGKSRSS